MTEGCQIEAYDGDPCEFYRSQIRKARKQYKCQECGEPIRPGDKYEYTSGKCDGDLFNHRTCALCEEIRSRVFCSWTLGGMWEDLREHSVFTLSLAGLSAGAIEKLEVFWRQVRRDE